MKTTITPQQALKQITSGHLCQLKGLDVQDFTYIFNDAKEVILLTYYLKDQATIATAIEENESEIRKCAVNATGVMLQLICGKSHNLLIEDMLVINMVNDLFPKNTALSWDVQHSESTDFKLRIDLYIVTQ